ncbi:MAG: hypothetical protein ACRYG8_24230 [Janthinobacterium lividum]
MADVFRIGVSIALTNGMSSVLGVIQRDLLGLNHHVDESVAKLGRVKAAMMGLGAVVIGGAVLDGMGKLVEHGREFVHQQSLMAQGGVRVAEIADATAAAWKTAGSVIGTNVTDNLKTVADLRNVLGGMDKAILALPELAKINVVLGNVTGQPAEDAGYKYARFLELRGALVNPKTEQIDPTRLQEQARLGEAIIAGMRGRVGPQDLLMFQQQGRAATAGLTDQGLINAVPYIQAGGGSRTGTQVSSLLQQLVGGVLTKAGATFLQHANVLNMSKVHEGKGGHMTFDAGAIKDESLLRTDFAGWIDKTLRAGLVAAGDKTVDAQTADLMRSHLRATVVGLLVEGIRSAPAFNKDAQNITNALKVDQYAVGQQTDPTAKIHAFHEAWENLLTALGSPLVDPATNLLRGLTVQLTSFGQWAAAHPGLVLRIGEVTVGLAALAVVGGSLTIVGAALGPFTGALSAFLGTMGGAQVGAATTAAAALGGGSLLGVAGGLVALSAAVVGLPPMLSAAVTGLNEMLGIKGNPDASGRAGQAQAREYLRTHDGPAIPGVTPKPSESWGDWWKRETAGPAPHQQLRGGGATVQPQSYVPPPTTGQAIVTHVTFKADMREIAKGTIVHMDRMNSGASTGTTGFDGRQTMTPPGMITA